MNTKTSPSLHSWLPYIATDQREQEERRRDTGREG